MSASILGISSAITAMPRPVSGASGAGAPPQSKMTNLFNSISGGASSISQAQFTKAFQSPSTPAPFKAAGASAVWQALDPTGSGQVSKADFVNTMKNLMVSLRQGGGASAAQTSASATQSLNNLTA